MSADTEAARLRALCEEVLSTAECFVEDENFAHPDQARYNLAQFRHRLAAIPVGTGEGFRAMLEARVGELASKPLSGLGARVALDLDTGNRVQVEASLLLDTLAPSGAADPSPLPFSPAAAKAASEALGWEWSRFADVAGRIHLTAWSKDGNTKHVEMRRDADGLVVFSATRRTLTAQGWLAALHGVTLVEQGR